MDNSNDSYIHYLCAVFSGHIWTVTGLNIFMQKFATFAYNKSLVIPQPFMAFRAQHESIKCEKYPNISLQGDQIKMCNFFFL